MAGFLSPLSAFAKAYPGLTSAKRLQAYTASRLPADLRSRGDLIPMSSGTGRIPFALGDDLVVKTARMPRGIKENSMEGDWVAPVPEAVWKSDDDAVAVVKRALPADAKLKRQVKAMQPTLANAEAAERRLNNLSPEWVKTLEGQATRENLTKVLADREEALGELGWDSLLNYKPLWGDIAPRNVGLNPSSSSREALLLDAGILDADILNPKAMQQFISPADWMKYRNEVLRAKKDGGLVQMAGAGLVKKMLQGMYRGRGSSQMPVDEVGRVFMSPQRRYAEYYANRRVAENPAERGEPVVDMFLVDPFNTPRQGHSVKTDRFNDFEHIFSRIAKPQVDDVGDPISTTLVPESKVRKATGGLVQMRNTKCR